MHARKNLHLILASQIYKEVTSYPRYQWASQVFPKIIVMVVGLLHVWLIRDINFIVKTGNHQDSLRDVEAAIELNPTFLKAIVRGNRYVSCAVMIIKKKSSTLLKVQWS